jgi:ferredoxin
MENSINNSMFDEATGSTESDTVTLIFEHDPQPKLLKAGESIIAVCEDAGVPFACTEGVCGTCVIEVTEGMENLSPFNQEEEDFLGEKDIERLACQCKLMRGCVKVKF